MLDRERQDLLNKDLIIISDAKSFLSNFQYFMDRAVYQYEKDELVQQKRYYMKALIRVGLENMP